MSKQYLTKEWYERLLGELKMLKDEKLPWVLIRLKEALWQWDLSENAEYDTAILEKDLTEARISEIEKLLKDVEIIDEKEAKWSKEVRHWSKVTFETESW
jgi:transcription elongation factor GreA